MNHETAKAALDHCDNAMTELDKALRVLKEQASPEEFARLSTAMTHVWVAMIDVRGPMHLEHPDLDVHQVTVPYARKVGPRPAVEQPRTAEEKLDLLQALAGDFRERALSGPNVDLSRLCFRECAAAGELAERLPREKPEAALVSAERILDSLTRIAGFLVGLSERDQGPPRDEPTKH
jgi:hypothetical protein